MSDQASEPYFRVGEGRISGWISVILGALSVLGVLCFHFPDYLTTPQLRAAYTVEEMRYLLGAGMVFSAAFGLVTFVLNRHKLMGAIGISLTLLAMWAGGASVQIGPRYAAPGYIGLDWFILDLLLSAMIFIFLEKLWPHIREQAILRPDFWHDSRYFLMNHLLIGVYAFAATMFAPTFFSWAINHDIQAFVSSLPWVIQFFMAIVLADLVEYAIHRTMHEVKFFWPIHAVHHSVEHMDWLAGSRLHFLEPFVMRALVLVPAFILGIAKEPLTVYIVFAGFQAGLIHANIRWDLGPSNTCWPRRATTTGIIRATKRRSTRITSPTCRSSTGCSERFTCRRTSRSGRADTARSGCHCPRESSGSSFTRSGRTAERMPTRTAKPGPSMTFRWEAARCRLRRIDVSLSSTAAPLQPWRLRRVRRAWPRRPRAPRRC